LKLKNQIPDFTVPLALSATLFFCEEKILLTCITFDDISPTYLSASDLKHLIDFLTELDLPATFFVIPSQQARSSFKKEFNSCLEMAPDFGHELSLHGYQHVKNEFGYFYPVPLSFLPIPGYNEQVVAIGIAKRILEEFSGVRPLGFRAPFYLHNRATLMALSCLGFKYDSSETLFKPTHASNFRLRWPNSHKPYKFENIMEIPVTGDYTYNLKATNFSDSMLKALRDFEWIKSRDGVFVVNTHPNRMDLSLLHAFLKTLKNKLQGKTEFVSLSDVVSQRS
jgi:peptidoglycan/xylan/chitin deacetylase (PgdA/CDA1 family)